MVSVLSQSTLVGASVKFIAIGSCLPSEIVLVHVQVYSHVGQPLKDDLKKRKIRQAQLNSRNGQAHACSTQHIEEWIAKALLTALPVLGRRVMQPV